MCHTIQIIFLFNINYFVFHHFLGNKLLHSVWWIPTFRQVAKKFFSALQASVWSINKGEGGGQAPLTPHLDSPLIYCTLDIRERGKWPLDMHVVLTGGCTCKVDTNLFFFGGGGSF